MVSHLIIADLGNCDENANATMYKGELECYCKDGFYGNGSYCRGLLINIDFEIGEKYVDESILNILHFMFFMCRQILMNV